ncbi:uncharacterized protein LOC123700667 [Colias croceus]|uniref:uncharacterized protein LOC123700667 n=1 Tax=Colias crocea TaxID=72248 RepID=UPI001E27F23C|nr:uncharacterized protein LOC123700667 [Colias croceus]
MDNISLVQLCVGSFSDEEITCAKSLLQQALPNSKRMTQRKNKGKTARDVEDIVNLLKSVDPDIVPIFVARELRKLPPITFDHIDATRLLKDILILKQDIEYIKSNFAMKESVEKLQKNIGNLNKITDLSCYNNIQPSGSLSAQGHTDIPVSLTPAKSACCYQPDGSCAARRAVVCNEPVSADSETCITSQANQDISLLHAQNCISDRQPHHVTVTPNNTAKFMDLSTKRLGLSPRMSKPKQKTFADVMISNDYTKQREGEWIKVSYKNKPKNRFFASKGKGDSNIGGSFKAADIKIPFYIYNVDKAAEVDDIEKYIFDKTMVRVELSKITMKNNKQYQAFKFDIPRSKLSLFMDENIWPMGVAFRRYVYFKSKEPALRSNMEENKFFK